jgi:FtsP/CotA-like multicopper oxidase with cupredoxin domain
VVAFPLGRGAALVTPPKMRRTVLLSAAAALFGVALHAAPSARARTPPLDVERVMPNDNRAPAGTLRNGVLTLQLEARLASWHPDGDSAPGAVVPAFAEVGGAARIPGPLIRVPAGTVVQLTLRNRLDTTLAVYGLVDRIALAIGPRDSAVRLPPGATATVRFEAYAPGTYYYWGTTTGRPVAFRTKEDAQLSGAIVVDPVGPRRDDRILVIGMWTDTVARAFTERKRLLAVINGRSWPHTERLHYVVGDTARWRVINASSDAHPMHLHGFYFNVDGRGNGLSDTLYMPGLRDREFTEMLTVGGTFDMTWVPERPGNWLFHCHIAEHFARRGALGSQRPPAEAAASRHANHALEGMGGLVIGVTVLPARSATVASTTANETLRRHLRLLVRRNAGGSDSTPYLGFAIQQGTVTPRADSGLHFGPPLVLTRSEPVSITVVNALSEPTAVHWHGIELESYFDGVAGFSGSDGRTSPAIAPGDSFEARFTPPRSGTFIYHSHVEEERQLRGGLAGALIVLEPGERFDPTLDHVILLTSPTSLADQQRAVLVNGDLSPTPLTLRAGTRHWLRFVNMTLRRPTLRVELLRDSTTLEWRVLAKDASNFSEAARAPRRAMRNVGLGETLDVEITPDVPGTLRLDIRIGGARPPHTLLASLPVRVVP